MRDLSLGGWNAPGPGGRANLGDRSLRPSQNHRLRTGATGAPARSCQMVLPVEAGASSFPGQGCKSSAQPGPCGVRAYLLRALGARRWHSRVAVVCFPPLPVSCLTSHCRGSLV